MPHRRGYVYPRGINGWTAQRHAVGRFNYLDRRRAAGRTSKDLVIPSIRRLQTTKWSWRYSGWPKSLMVSIVVEITASTDTFIPDRDGRPMKVTCRVLKKVFIGIYKTPASKILKWKQRPFLPWRSIFNERAGAPFCYITTNRITDEFEINDEMQKRAGHVASLASRFHTCRMGYRRKKKGKRFFIRHSFHEDNHLSRPPWRGA